MAEYILIDYTNEEKAHLETLTKAERGKLWINRILKREPNYDIDKLYEYWEQCENTVETYEVEADKTKWIEEDLAESDASGTITLKSPQHLRQILDEMHRKNNATKSA